jgi:hypothetical protein
MVKTRIKRWVVVGIVLLALMAILRVPGMAQGGDIRYGDTVNGTLKAGETDTWHFVGSLGDVIALNVERTSGNLEPVLTLQNSDGQPVAGTQAASGQATASLVQVRLPQPGSYLVKVGGSGQTAGDYRLRLALTTAVARTPTPRPNVATGTFAGSLTYGAAVHGEIAGDVIRQSWRFRGAFGDVVDIRMVTTSGNLDPVLALVSPLGDTVAASGSTGGRPDAGIMAFQLPFTGEYIIVARRAGGGAGQEGTTSGRYDLTLALRGPGTAAQNTVLNIGAPIQSRLTDDVPLALYRLEVGGALAMLLDLGSLHRLVSLRFLTPDGNVLGTFRGLSPLAIATRLPDKGPFLVEVSSLNFEDRPSTSLTLTAYRLGAMTTSAQALYYGSTRRSVAREPDKWFFIGRKGDIISLNVTPDVTANDTIVRLTGPQDILLHQSYLGPGLQQVLTLPDTGAYEADIQPGTDQPSLSYTLSLDRIGANGIPLARFDMATDRGPLIGSAPTEGTLAAGAADAWWLDATAGQVINLIASPASLEAAPGLILRRPDGSTVDAEIGDRAQSAVIRQAVLDQTGRYRVVVFDSKGNTGGQYRLSYEEVAGGALHAGQVVKGMASPANALATWAIDVTAGALINARLTSLTPRAWTPSLFVADPGGLIIASTTPAAGQGPEVNLLGVEAPVSGRYHVVVAGQLTGTYASYNLLANVQAPFIAREGSAIQVATTQPVVGRYATVPPVGPIQLHPADLITPSISVDEALAKTQPLGSNSTARGEIAPGAQFQAWRFDAAQDTTIVLQAAALSGNGGPDLTLIDMSGKIVSEQYHTADLTATLTYRVLQSGPYVVAVSLGSTGGRYILSLNAQYIAAGPLQVSAGIPLAYGQTASGEILGSEDTNTYYFIGSANDILTAQLSRSTGDLVPGLALVSPRGVTVASDLNPGSSAAVSLSGVRLPENGIYALSVRHGEQGASTIGRYLLYLGLDSAVRLIHRGGGIIQPGETVTGLLNVGGVGDTWLFQGHMGERVTFIAAGIGSQLPAPLSLRLQDTAGYTFAVQDMVLTQGANRVANVMLPANGVYRVQMTGATQTPGAYTLTWESERRRLVAGPLSYNQVVGGIFTPDHNVDTWVFSGSAGDVISIALRFQQGDRFNGAFQLRSENGLPLVTAADQGDGSGARADSLLLPFSGSYSLVVANPDSSYKGVGVYSLSVNLRDSKASSMGGVLAYGQQGRGSLDTDDPSDTWLFRAQAGDTLHLSAQALDQFLKPVLELRSPDGTLLSSALPDSTSHHARAAIDKFAIETSGVYVVTVTGGPARSAGGYLLSLDSTPPPVAEIETVRYGETREGLIANDRPYQSRTFSGKRGDVVTAKMTREPGSNLTPTLEIQTAEGQVLVHADSNGLDSVTISDFELPEPGQYRLVSGRYLDTEGRTIGRYKVSLSGSPAAHPIKGTTGYGQLAIGRLDDQNPVDRITFAGKAGDVIGITSSAKSGDLDTQLALENSAGAVLAANDDANGTDAVITGFLLPADDTYTVVLSRAATKTFGSSGNYELYVNLLYQAKATTASQALITYGGRVVGTVDPSKPEADYTFSGSQGDEVAVQLVQQTDDAPPLLSIQDPAGTALAQGVLGVGQTTIDRYRLPISGMYTIAVKRPINTQLSFSPFALTLTLLTSPVEHPSEGGVVRPGEAITGVFVSGQAAQYWLFQARAGQVMSVDLLQLDGDLHPSLMVIDPGGHGLASAAMPTRGQSVTINQLPLPSDGVYSLLVLPGDSNRAGQYRLTLQVDASTDITPALLITGNAASGTLDASQPEQRWLFTGIQGQSVAARMLVTGGNLSPRLVLVDASGRTLAEGYLDRAPQGTECAIENVVLGASGVYALIAGQQADAAPSMGTYRLLLETGPLSAQAVAASPIAYGQLVHQVVQQGTTDNWVFNGAAGDTVNVAVTVADSADKNAKAPALILQDASGRTLAGATPAAATPGEAAIEGLTLPADGRYVVALPAATTANYALVVQRRQSLLAEGLNALPIIAGQPRDGVITGKETVTYWAFSAKAGSIAQIVGTRLSGDVRLDLALYAPGSSYVTSATAGPDSAGVTLGPVRLPDDGGYVVVATRWLGPAGKTTGRYSLALSFPTALPDSGGSIPIYGRPVTGGIAATGQGSDWTFEGQAGDVIDVRVTRLDGDLKPMLRLIGPDGGKEIASATGDQGEALISRASLPVTGRYHVLAGHSGTTAGGYKLVVSRVQTAVQASLGRAEGIAYGDKRDAELTADTPIRAWVFFGKAGDRVTIEAAPRAGSSLDPYLVLLAPDGSPLAADDNGGGNTVARLVSVVLPGDGFYGVTVSGSPRQEDSQRRGAFTLLVQRDQPGATYQGRIAPGGDVDGTLTAEQPIQEWVFEAEAGQSVIARLDSPSATFAVTLFIVTADGRTLAASGPAQNGAASADVTLPGPGQYAILVSANARGAAGRYHLSLSTVSPSGS